MSDWYPSSLGFAPKDPVANGGFDILSLFGQPKAAASGAVDWQGQLQTLLSNGDIEGASRIQGMMDTKGFNTEMLAKMDAMKQPPNPWVTGAQTFGTVAQGLAGLGNIWLGSQAMKQQKKAFEFNKGVTNTNLNNAIADYNRRLGDTLTNRALNNGQGQGWVSDQLAKYSAKRS